MRKKLPTQRSTQTPIPKNPPSSKGPQSHTYIHIHSHSSSSPSSHSTASMARKVIHPRGSTCKEVGSSKKKASKEKGPMPEEEEDFPSPPYRHSSPPRRSTPHPSSRSQCSKWPILHDTREPSNLDSLDFKNKYGKIHSHFDPYRFISCEAYEFHSQVLDANVGISLQEAQARVCENFSSLDGTNLTHKAFGPVRPLLHWIITHVIMPQSGAYQRHFNVDLSNEPVENRVSTIKGGGVPESAKEKKAKSSKASIFSESEDESLPPETSDQTRFSEIVKDVLTEFSNMSNLMVKSYKEARNQAFENEKAWTKCRERVNLLIKSLETVDKDTANSEGEAS
ncbi:uncharacterized protein DS421_12g363160 [Arachis hypogaea]|nr:uncharacterized protein DS421_12g363160 [Arachis hypogaea]